MKNEKEAEEQVKPDKYSLSGVNITIEDLFENLTKYNDEATIITMDKSEGSLVVGSNQTIEPMALVGMLYLAIDEIKARIQSAQDDSDNE